MIKSKASKQKRENDISLGNYFERLLLKYLNEQPEYKGDQFSLSQYQYSIFDIKNSKITGELKTRRVSHRRYPDTMIGQNKIVRAQNDDSGILYRFYFIFTDGLYYWDFNDEQYTTRKGGRTDRGRAEIKDYCFISVKFLKLITTDIKSISQITDNAHSTSEIIIS